MSPTLHELLHQARLSTHLCLLMLSSRTAATRNTKARRLRPWTLTVLYLHADLLCPHQRLWNQTTQSQIAIPVHCHPLPQSSTLHRGSEVTTKTTVTTMTTHNQCSLLISGSTRRGEHSIKPLVESGNWIFYPQKYGDMAGRISDDYGQRSSW